MTPPRVVGKVGDASVGHPCRLPAAARREMEMMLQGTEHLGGAGPLAPGQDLGGLAIPAAPGRCPAPQQGDTAFDNPNR